MPLNSFGDDVTIIFHAAVAVNDNHIAVIARLVDSSDPAKWNPRTAACYNDIVPTAINYKTKKIIFSCISYAHSPNHWWNDGEFFLFLEFFTPI